MPFLSLFCEIGLIPFSAQRRGSVSEVDSCEQPRDLLLLHSDRPLVLPRRRRGRHIALNLQPAVLRPTSRR